MQRPRLMGKSSIRRDTAMAVDALRHFSKAFVRENLGPTWRSGKGILLKLAWSHKGKAAAA